MIFIVSRLPIQRMDYKFNDPQLYSGCNSNGWSLNINSFLPKYHLVLHEPAQMLSQHTRSSTFFLVSITPQRKLGWALPAPFTATVLFQRACGISFLLICIVFYITVWFLFDLWLCIYIFIMVCILLATLAYGNGVMWNFKKCNYNCGIMTDCYYYYYYYLLLLLLLRLLLLL